ncbi:hypothetical protein Gpo141_00012185 [Globisporangium polare]
MTRSLLLRASSAVLLALCCVASSSTAAAQDTNVSLVSACSSNLSDPEAPVLASLTSTFGVDAIEAARTFISATTVGKLLFSSEASTCLANLDGAKLSDALKSGLATDKCAVMKTVTNLSFVQHLIGNLTAKTDTLGFTKLLRNVSSAEFDDFCGLYADQVVPCLTSELLPAIATIRAKYASGCCDAWATSAVRDYGYTVSDQLTKFAQLLGDVVCSRQTPSFLGNASQVCGYTFSQSSFTANDSATLGSDLIVDLQVPTDQMCLKAEGKAYVDVNGANVAASSTPTASGCVVAIDRVATWAAALPLAQRTNTFDVQALFSTTKCLKGSEFFPLVSDFFPPDVNAVVAAYFSKACVHIPIKYADKCSYTRSVSLVDWASEPSKVKAQDLGSGGSAVSSDPTSNISFNTEAPVKSSAAGVRPSSTSVVLMVVTTATLALALSDGY